MPKPYPKEFRDDVVAVARKGDAPLKQIAKDFADNPTGKTSRVLLRDGTTGIKFRTPGSPGGLFDGYFRNLTTKMDVEFK